MATLLLYHSSIFSSIMMRVESEDWELGQSISLLAASCWQGALYGVSSSDSYGVLVGALIAVLWMVLEMLISLEVELVKLLISNIKHAI
jgi:inner membrane protein involved in colicin E2 resistance